MSKLDKFVNVLYQRKISQFSDIDYDTVVVISNTKVGEDGKIGDNTDSTVPMIYSSASSFPETLGATVKTIGKRVLDHGKRVCFWNKQLKNKYCYLFMDYVSDVGTEVDENGDETGNWDKTGEGNDKFMLVFPSHLYDVTNTVANKYKQNVFTGAAYDPTVGSRIVVCGKRSESDDNIPNVPEDSELTKEKKWVLNNTFIAASVSGVIAGGYRNFTTHLRQIISAEEDRQLSNPSSPTQSLYIGNVVLAGNSFLEGSVTRGAVAAATTENPSPVPTNRKYIDRQVLEDRLQSRLQEECLKVMTYGDGIPFTQQGANMIAAAGAVALSEAAGLKIIDDFETSVNYDLVTDADIEARKYDKLVYKFRFSGSIEYVEVVLEV